ncbi:sensor histidine kinase inhibitor, KipI family [Actinobaculum suis]|uniref:5-oxoprolinase/urea amidolyase family protein n=1 Tax=Actinobaculum suis TaxID=1657 RepID=A0A1G7ARL2_9ACTO|nr:5-oxoprolinase/urea amidolyase family protein [Actinobaculum suis]MDY5153414.1 5-oxoprolinase/urea amidolyase family protein [Actinobaculum suis]SDE17443.1 sensor histidine kinase inhibitor, KipI family [Actinobaculum suis]
MSFEPESLLVLPAAEDTVLVEYPDLDAVLAHYPALVASKIYGVRELVPAARTIAVYFEPSMSSAREIAEAVRSVEPLDVVAHGGEPTEIEVVYNGEDLAEVADLFGVSTTELITRHQAAHWKVAFVGFAPGFAYCVGDDELFAATPRRTTPRTRIPAGSVGLAANFSAVYPGESPGGWQLIGNSRAPMWDIHRTSPALLSPGDAVKYVAVPEEIQLAPPASPESTSPESASAEPASPDLVSSESVSSESVSPESVSPESAGAVGQSTSGAEKAGAVSAPAAAPEPADSTALPERYWEIINPGVQMIFEDLGRPGLLNIGVAAAGAADHQSLMAANSAVGNAPDTAALEIAGGGAEIRSHARCEIAIAGATGEVTVTEAETGYSFALTPGLPAAIEPGDTISIGWFDRGVRAYLAVRGGYEVEPILGSRSLDTLAGLGPQALTAGSIVPLSEKVASGVVADAPTVGTKLPTEEEVTLRIVLGPRTDWFTAAALENLTAQAWKVTPQSDRVGIRLEGEKPLARAREGELQSEGAVTGAIQVPTSGQPVIFLADHPLTGGYPVIGSLVRSDIDTAAQIRPGTTIRFKIVTPFTQL